MLKRTQAADMALNGTKGVGGFADTEEVREIYNKGQTKLDVTKKIKPRTPPLPAPKPPTKPDAKELKGKDAAKADAARLGISLDEYYKQQTDLYKFQLDTATKAMIERKKKIAEREKALGEQVLKEQEENV